MLVLPSNTLGAVLSISAVLPLLVPHPPFASLSSITGGLPAVNGWLMHVLLSLLWKPAETACFACHPIHQVYASLLCSQAC